MTPPAASCEIEYVTAIQEVLWAVVRGQVTDAFGEESRGP
jgi:hypothetical protein